MLYYREGSGKTDITDRELNYRPEPENEGNNRKLQVVTDALPQPLTELQCGPQEV